MLTQPRARTPTDPTTIERTVLALRDAAARCIGCDLYKNATQTVFREGPLRAPVMLVGEQPGDVEDLTRRPFVGPARKLLDRFWPRPGSTGRRPMSPTSSSTSNGYRAGRGAFTASRARSRSKGCLPWFEAETSVVAPRVVVALGATAAQALFGKASRVTRDRGRLVPFALVPYALATVHPSALLRAPDEETRRQEILRFIEDLCQVVQISGGEG